MLTSSQDLQLTTKNLHLFSQLLDVSAEFGVQPEILLHDGVLRLPHLLAQRLLELSEERSEGLGHGRGDPAA